MAFSGRKTGLKKLHHMYLYHHHLDSLTLSFLLGLLIFLRCRHTFNCAQDILKSYMEHKMIQCKGCKRNSISFNNYVDQGGLAGFANSVSQQTAPPVFVHCTVTLSSGSSTPLNCCWSAIVASQTRGTSRSCSRLLSLQGSSQSLLYHGSSC